MATYEELFDLRSDSVLRNRVAVAIAVAAEGIRTEAPATEHHAERVVWAKQAMNSTEALVAGMYVAVVAANASATVEQITQATDAAIQANVDAAVDFFATGA